MRYAAVLLILGAGCSAEWRGKRKCEKGVKLVEACVALASRANLTPEERREVRAGLEEGMRLLTEGFEHLDQASQEGETQADLQRYSQAMKVARFKLLEKIEPLAPKVRPISFLPSPSRPAGAWRA